MRETGDPRHPLGVPSPDKGLRQDALGAVASVVIGVGSTAPAYSLAASLGLIAGAVGLQAPAVLWIAFVPMFCVAVAYAAMNRKSPDCGTTFTWVRRAMGPHMGWMAGWAVVVANLIVMSSLGHVAGSYTIRLFLGSDPSTHSAFVFVAGLLWIAGMTWLCVRGIETTARTQMVLLAGELIVLAMVALLGLAGRQAQGAVGFQLRWLDPRAIPSSAALAHGFLLAVFLYWGWDTAVSVNEETRNAHHTPGRAAVVSTLVLVATYVLCAAGAQAWRGESFLVAHADDVLMALGHDTLGPPYDRIVALAVLASAAACTQTTILPSARTALSMAAAHALPSFVGRVHAKHKTPHVATILFGIAAGVWHVSLGLLGADPLADGVPALGLVISLYLGLSSLACPILHGRELFHTLRTFVTAGLLPLLGGATFLWVLVQSVLDLAAHDRHRIVGVSASLLMAIGLLALGAGIMVAQQLVAPAYFCRTRTPDP